MTSEEEASYRAVYAGWSNAHLARALTLEKSEFQPEAITLMFGELKKRGLSEAALSEVVASTPPTLTGTLPERDTWLFPARLNRRRYLIRTCIFLVSVIAGAAAMETLPVLQPGGFWILLLASLGYGGIGLFIPRSKDAGLPSSLAIVFVLIPAIGLAVSMGLFFIPSKGRTGGLPTTPGNAGDSPASRDRAIGPVSKI